jgi:hypothetical protein
MLTWAPFAAAAVVMSDGVMSGSSADRLVLYARLSNESKLMAIVTAKLA